MKIIIFIYLIFCLSIFINCNSRSDNKEKHLAFLAGLVTLSNANSSASSDCLSSNISPTVDSISGLTRIQVKPSIAATCIKNYDEPHNIYPPSITQKGILSVFLPGTDATPNDYSLILQRGATRGYHTIGLSYPNPDAVNTICNSGLPTSLTCHGEVREEILTGKDKSTLVAIDINNSIEGRLVALLKYLIKHRPNEGWDKFLSSNQLVFSKLYVGGHSQGSGHAGYHGKIRAIGRVSIYSGTSDYVTQTSSLPNWMYLNQMAPQGSYFGFIHLNDSIANFSGNANQVTNSWLSPLGMSGTLTDVAVGSPYANSNRLSTNACAAMSSLVRHACPIYNGYQSVWDYISYP
jgi:hypothetical protein